MSRQPTRDEIARAIVRAVAPGIITAARPRGFAAWKDKEKVREAAREGGKTAHVLGVAHRFTPEEAREAGRKGGAASRRNLRARKELP